MFDAKAIRMVARHLRARTEPPFNMSSRETCIMYDVRTLFPCPEDFEQVGKTLGLSHDEAWELFFAGSILSAERELESFTKDEALQVLDYAAENGVTETLWHDVIDHKTFHRAG